MSEINQSHILAANNIYYDLIAVHERLDGQNLMMSYETLVKESFAVVNAYHRGDSQSYAFVSTYPNSDRWYEIYSCELFPDDEMAKFSVLQGCGTQFEVTPNAALWGEFQQEFRLVVPNSLDRLAFGAILSRCRAETC